MHHLLTWVTILLWKIYINRILLWGITLGLKDFQGRKLLCIWPILQFLCSLPWGMFAKAIINSSHASKNFLTSTDFGKNFSGWSQYSGKYKNGTENFFSRFWPTVWDFEKWPFLAAMLITKFFCAEDSKICYKHKSIQNSNVLHRREIRSIYCFWTEKIDFERGKIGIFPSPMSKLTKRFSNTIFVLSQVLTSSGKVFVKIHWREKLLMPVMPSLFDNSYLSIM